MSRADFFFFSAFEGQSRRSKDWVEETAEIAALREGAKQFLLKGQKSCFIWRRYLRIKTLKEKAPETLFCLLSKVHP